MPEKKTTTKNTKKVKESVVKKNKDSKNEVKVEKKSTKKSEKENVKVIKNDVVKDNIKESKQPKKIKTSTNGTTFAVGKKKNAIAKVYLKKGSGKITINGKTPKEYLKRDILNIIINLPFTETNTSGIYDVVCKVVGGGLTGQADAIKHGISVALQLLNPELRSTLKKLGYLTRDSRVVERKKSGFKKARKGQVYQRR